MVDSPNLPLESIVAMLVDKFSEHARAATVSILMSADHESDSSDLDDPNH
jgi:hypothetical protein